MRRKLKNNKGFSVIEMLCAVAILALLCLVISAGFNMAINSYRDSMAESETRLLVDNLSAALNGKLRYARESDAGKFNINDAKVEYNDQPLLPDGAYGASGIFGLAYIGTYEVVAADNGSGGELPIVKFDSGSFTVKFTVKSSKVPAISRDVAFTVRSLNQK